MKRGCVFLKRGNCHDEPRKTEFDCAMMLPDAILPLDTIFLGDCRDFLRGLPDRCVDLVTSSPPFSYANVERRCKGTEDRLFNLLKLAESRKSFQVYLDRETEVLKDCCRILKDTGSLFWQLGFLADA